MAERWDRDSCLGGHAHHGHHIQAHEHLKNEMNMPRKLGGENHP